MFNRKLTPKGQGMFNAEQRKTLAKRLAEFKLLRLPAKTGKPSVNRQMLRIQYGKRTSAYIFGAGALLPKADPKTVPGRFGGIFRSVMKMTARPK